ncbi:MAG: 50S ribosomal protein L23 [bacterium]
MSKIIEKNRRILTLKKLHITEKTSMNSAKTNPAYTFVVAPETNKNEIKKAIKESYKVTPVKVNIINLPSKDVFVRGKRGVKSGMKKAVVYLKKGDKIDFI